ncbi:MAG: hypothetical protein ACYCZA_11810 [Thiobacillus sp.]
MFRQFISWVPLLFVMAAQAAPDNQSTLSGETAAPTPAPESRLSDAVGAGHSGESSGVKETTPRGGSRYGIGFEARQGRDRDGRIERPERSGRIEIERGSRGR